MTPQPIRARHPSRADIGIGRRHGDPSTRLLLKPVAPKTGYVDGAWWPYSDDLVTELPRLLTALTKRLSAVHLVAYHLAEWDRAPAELVFDDQPVRLDSQSRTTSHTVDLLGSDNRRLLLLVVPSGSDPGDAYAAMTSAATTNNTSTAADLLQIGIRKRRERKQRAAAVRRWAARTTSVN
ncbi:DUF5994 family protein [Nocardia tengchongensis]